MKRSMIVVSVVLACLVLIITSPAAAQRALRVGCQVGKPPFTDAENEMMNSTKCVGLFGEIFDLIAERSELNYTMKMVKEEHLEHLLQIQPPATEPEFDMMIAFHTITPSRMEVVDFSIGLYLSDYRFALRPSFHAPAGTLQDAVLRDSVYYLTGVMSLVMFGAGLVILISEQLSRSSEIHDKPYWMRPLWAMELGFEVVITSTTPVDLRNQIGKTLRVVFALMGLFVMNITAAVITSQLTVSATSVSTVDLNQLAGSGHKIAHSSETLDIFLKAKNIEPQNESSIEAFAEEFYKGNAPSSIDGFIAASDVVVFLHNQKGGATGDFVVSQPITVSGSKDLKGYPFAKTVPNATVAAFSQQLEVMRQDGELSKLKTKYVQAVKTQQPNDFPIHPPTLTGLRIFCYVFFGVTVVGCYALGLITKIKEKQEQEQKGTVGEEELEEIKKDIVEVDGVEYRVPEELRAVMETIVSQGRPLEDGEQNGVGAATPGAAS